MHLSLGHQFFELRCRHVVGDPLRVQRTVIRRTEIGQERGHLVERTPTDGFVIASTGEIVADLLLMVPEETVQRENVGIADVGHRVAGRVRAVRCLVFHCLRLIVGNENGEVQRFADRQDEVSGQLERRAEIVVEATHVEFFGEDQIVGNVLEDLRDQSQATLDARQRLRVDNAELMRQDQGRIEKAKKDHRGHRLRRKEKRHHRSRRTVYLQRMLREALLNHLEETRAENSQLNGKLRGGVDDRLEDVLCQETKILAILVQQFVLFDASGIDFVRAKIGDEHLRQDRREEIVQIMRAVEFEAEGHDLRRQPVAPQDRLVAIGHFHFLGEHVRQELME